MLPGYKKLTGFFRDRGIRHILVDSDGDIWKLIPLFIEGGVTGIYPFEVMAGMNVADGAPGLPAPANPGRDRQDRADARA